MATIGTILFTMLRGKKAGTDEFGNIYYMNSKKSRRWVVYKGTAEASKVPAEWHRWLHKTTDEVPNNLPSHSWEKPHLPNLTGTDMAYVPKGHLNSGTKRNRATGDYEPWKPE